LLRASVELAKDWRTDRVLRRLEALLLVADREKILMLSGTGDIIEPDCDTAAVARAVLTPWPRRAPYWPTRSFRRARSPSAACASPPTSASTPTPTSPSRSSSGQSSKRPEALTPRAIVEELDRYIVGQREAKRAVAVALRNRWRRQQVPPPMRDEISPKNIMLIGPTGVGKTEIARRLAKLAGAPFVKVEASKFTEVGYVGRDVDSMVRDLARPPCPCCVKKSASVRGHVPGRMPRSACSTYCCRRRAAAPSHGIPGRRARSARGRSRHACGGQQHARKPAPPLARRQA